MHRFVLLIGTWWLWVQLVAALPTPDLVRVPRHVWDTDLVKRDAAAVDKAEADKAVKLGDHEEFIWASNNRHGEKAVVVSMVAYSKQNERIIDMDKFSWAIKSASCTEEDMSLTFVNDLIYYAAKTAWNWVNFNEMHSFVLVPSSNKCGHDKSHIPFVVSSVTFDDKKKRVEMDATKSTWKKVMNTFVLDFGEVVIGGGGHNQRDLVPDKRDIIPDLDKKFTLDVSATLPEKLFEWTIDEGVLSGNLTANCNDCGTQGALVFAGHIEASLGFTGLSVDKFEISVKPQDVAIHVGLSLEFFGYLDFREFVKPSQEINLLSIPVSGWKIPGIFQFGPSIELNAGYEISYISGHAEASAGITARIPNSAIAKLDLLSEDSVQISGWAPEIETEPLEVEIMIDAEASLFTEIALTVSMTVLDSDGFGVDIGFKVPKVTATASAGFVSSGFCPNDPDPFGVQLDATVGVDLDLEGWKEVDGVRDILFDVGLYENPDILTFPPVCVSFGAVSEGYCLPEEEDDAPEDSPDSTNNKRALVGRSLNNQLVSRQTETSRKYNLACDKSKQVVVLSYSDPSVLKNDVRVPIVVPSFPCPDSTEDCLPNANITVITTPAEQRAIVVNKKGQNHEELWNSEHIYEGNWVRDFMNYLNSKLNGTSQACASSIPKFWDTLNPVYDKPPGGRQMETYILAMMQQLGTVVTKDRMALLQMRLNNIKFAMFAQTEIVGPERRKTINTHHRWACELARISAACKYYDAELVRAGLEKTVNGLESVLAAADNDTRIATSGFSFKDAHVDFYNDFYKTAIDYTRGKLKQYAEELTGDSAGMDSLPDDVAAAIRRLATDSGYREQVCPSTPRSQW